MARHLKLLPLLAVSATLGASHSQAVDHETVAAMLIIQQMTSSEVLIPLDTDGDGLPDYLDNDDDNDGYPDNVDDYPFDPTRPAPSGDGTAISGEVTEDLTLDLDGSPYTITSSLTVAKGSTLFIRPGVILQTRPGAPTWHGLKLFGDLVAIGTADFPVIINASVVQPDDKQPNSVTLHYVQVGGFDLRLAAPTSLSIESSSFGGAVGVLDGYPHPNDCVVRDSEIAGHLRCSGVVRGNILRGGLSIASDAPGEVSENYIFETLYTDAAGGHYECNLLRDARIEIRTDATVKRNAIRGTSSVISWARGYNFSSNDLKFAYKYNTVRLEFAADNYWGTEDTGLIDGWIYDSHDSPNVKYQTIYQPILLSPPEPCHP